MSVPFYVEEDDREQLVPEWLVLVPICAGRRVPGFFRTVDPKQMPWEACEAGGWFGPSDVIDIGRVEYARMATREEIRRAKSGNAT